MSAAAAAGSLPREVNAFFGRATEIAAIIELLDQHQLVTITGTGGVGKTRVALQVAIRQQRKDGVWFVDLGSVPDPSRVVPKIMSVVPLRSLGASCSFHRCCCALFCVQVGAGAARRSPRGIRVVLVARKRRAGTQT